MSTMTLSIIILVFVIGLILVTGLVMFFVKRGQYSREVRHKLKCVFFPPVGMPYSRLIEIDATERPNIFRAPVGHKLPFYFYDKANQWPTLYPENPFLGITAIQVQVSTVYHFEENPEPITSNPFRPLVNSTEIGLAIDQAFALVMNEVDEELQKTKTQLLEALATKLNKNIVYLSLGAILLVGVVSVVIGVIMYQHLATVIKSLQMIGVR